jgi:hypothetical protein
MLPQCHVNIFLPNTQIPQPQEVEGRWHYLLWFHSKWENAKFANKMVSPLHPCRKTLRRGQYFSFGFTQKVRCRVCQLSVVNEWMNECHEWLLLTLARFKKKLWSLIWLHSKRGDAKSLPTKCDWMGLLQVITFIGFKKGALYRV